MSDQPEPGFPNGNPRQGAAQRFAAAYTPDGTPRDPREMSKDALRALGHQGVILRAVRANCLACCSGSPVEVRNCRMAWCPMWPYRMGENPFNTRTLTEPQREALRARFAIRYGEKT